MLESITYYLALITLVTVPATLVAWLLLHSFASRWRRIGPVISYAAIGTVTMVVMLGMYLGRTPLLGVHFGFRVPLAAVSIVLLGFSFYINARVYKQTPVPMIFGLGETSMKHTGELVTGGIYARIRHPRFVAMALAVAAMALFTNVLAVYVLAVLYVPVICLIAFLEDRELADRFGAPYREYNRAVPGFIPRLTKDRALERGDTT